MPATHLIRVDLPAPLSPTSAITWPAFTWKSTWSSATTAPKCLDTPRSSNSGCSSLNAPPPLRHQGAPQRGAPYTRCWSLDPSLLAQGREFPNAQLAALDESVLDHRVLDVVLRHRDRLQEDRRRLLGLVGALRVGLRLLTLRQRDRHLGRGGGLLLDRLVDRHVLLTGEEVLDPLDGGVLPGDRDVRELAGLERRDGGVRQPVVRRDRRVDLVVRLLEELLEDRQRLLVVPLLDRLVRALLVRAVLVERVENPVVALRQQGRVVVLGPAVQLGDDGGLEPLLLDPIDEVQAHLP